MLIVQKDQDSSRPASPAPAKPAAAPAAPAPAAPRGQQKPKASPASRGGKYYARGGKPAAKDGSAAPAAEDAPVDGQKKCMFTFLYFYPIRSNSSIVFYQSRVDAVLVLAAAVVVLPVEAGVPSTSTPPPERRA